MMNFSLEGKVDVLSLFTFLIIVLAFFLTVIRTFFYKNKISKFTNFLEKNNIKWGDIISISTHHISDSRSVEIKTHTKTYRFRAYSISELHKINELIMNTNLFEIEDEGSLLVEAKRWKKKGQVYKYTSLIDRVFSFEYSSHPKISKILYILIAFSMFIVAFVLMLLM